MENIIKLTNSQRGHYKLEQDTSELIKKCYKLQCEGNKITPEKIHALCQLTWWDGDKNKPLKTLWNIKEIPEHIRKMANDKAIGFIGFYKPYRNSSLKWIRENFKILKDLFHMASKIRTDEEGMLIISKINKLPKIFKPNSKKGPISPINLLSPVFACLDPRSRFPIINGNKNVKKLLKKLEIDNESLESQFNTLIGLIGQYGIKDALMLDVVSAMLADIVKKANISSNEPDEKEKPLNEKDDSDIEILKKSLSIKAKRIHNSMTNALIKKIKEKKLEILEGPQKNKYDALIKNYDNNGRYLLIEVKSSSDRPNLRLAVGQLLDYRRKLESRAVTDLAILVPDKPDEDSLDFLNYIGIIVMWFSDKGFKKIKGTKEFLNS